MTLKSVLNNIDFHDASAYTPVRKEGKPLTTYLSSVALNALKKQEGKSDDRAVFGEEYDKVECHFKKQKKSRVNFPRYNYL